MSRARLALAAAKLALVTVTMLVATGGPAATFGPSLSTAFDSTPDARPDSTSSATVVLTP